MDARYPDEPEKKPDLHKQSILLAKSVIREMCCWSQEGKRPLPRDRPPTYKQAHLCSADRVVDSGSTRRYHRPSIEAGRAGERCTIPKLLDPNPASPFNKTI
jgi:hypothetical protein